MADTVLSKNQEYFKYIFKKTEKIVCAVLFMTRSSEGIVLDDPIVKDTEDTARHLLGVAIRTLTAPSLERDRELQTLQNLLIEIESRLRLLYAAHLIPQEHLNVFIGEIDATQRTLKRYVSSTTENPFAGFGTDLQSEARIQRRERGIARLGASSSSGAEKTDKTEGGNRRERILAILRDKGEATIKDISVLVTDCSEKTIQRELISLIKDGAIMREGERRWSKYRLM